MHPRIEAVSPSSASLKTIDNNFVGEVEARFDIEMTGSASRGRRPFVLYKPEDPEICKYMFHFFEGLYIYAKCLDHHGRNETNVTAVRSVNSCEAWNDIRYVAIIVEKKWSKQTKLGQSARSVL